MHRSTLRFMLLLSFTGIVYQSHAQNCVQTNLPAVSTPLNGLVINLPCGQTCTNITYQTPHFKHTSDYLVTSIPYNPLPFLSATGAEDPILYSDDQYSAQIVLPFSFPFYDSLFSKTVVGSNGLLTFDMANASCGNSWPITQTIPYAGGTICSSGTTYYPKASIMGCYSDLDPRSGIASPADRKIQWRVEGTAPCRKYVISYYHIGVYGNPGCGLSTPHTFEMIMYESSGIIEVHYQNVSCASSTNNGRAILGIQNWNRNLAQAGPGMNETNGSAWQLSNQAFRFTPNAGASNFVSSELLTLSGLHMTWGDTSTVTPGLLNINYPSVCLIGTQTKYVIKTIFTSNVDPTVQLISTDTVTLNQTSELNATATSAASTCGPPTGTVTVTIPAAAGTAPFAYTLDNPPAQTSNNHTYTFTGVAPGNHWIYVSDANGCGSTLQINVGLNSNIPITASTSPTSCTGVNNGIITVTPPSTTPPYVYSLNGGLPQASNIFSNVAPGNYTVAVQDGGGCSGNTNVTVNIGPPLTATASSTGTSCAGVNNGTITITPTSGTGPYQYSMDGAAYQSSNVFTNVSSGTHYIVVKDNFGCMSGSIAVTVTTGVPLNGSATSTPTSCNGVNNGTVTVTAMAGTGPYQYSLDGGSLQSSNVFTNVSGGNHNVTFIDAIGCSSNTIPVTVAAGAGPGGTATSTSTSCAAVNNGTITANGSNGTSPYQFSIDGGAYQLANTFTNVSAGNHNVVVKDASGCISSSIPVTVAAGAGPGGTATSTSTSCVGVSNGTVTANGINGTAPYQFSLDGGAYQLANTFTNVSAGNHNVVVKDASGCISSSIPVNVATGSGVTATTSSIATSCNGVNNGTITVTPTNGSAPYQYSLDGAAYQLSNVFTNVSAGNHNVVIIDATTCTSAAIPVTVAAGAGPSGTAITTATSCSGATNGTITVTPANGQAPYQFALDGGAYQAGNVFNNIAAGNHNIVVKDAVGCLSAAIFVTVNPGAPLNVNVVSTNTSCSGASNGTITLNPANGSSPYQYSLNGGGSQTTNIYNNLAAGNYTINVVDANGCSANNLTATIAAGSGLTAIINQTNITCNGMNNGSIAVNVQAPGTAPFQYSLDNITFQPSNTFSNLIAGNYTVYFKDNISCTGSQTVTITQPAALTATVNSQPVACFGQSNGSITINASGGVTPYQYSINGGAYQNSNIFAVAIGTYSVSIKDNNGCIKTYPNITITQPNVLTLNAVTQAASCNGGADGVITATAAGGNSNYQYSIDGINFQPSNVFNVIAGSYTVTVKDANNCSATKAATVILTNNLTFSKGNDTTICEGGSAQLTTTSNAATYSWTPTTALNNATAANPVANPTITTQYTVTATLGGCSTSGTIKVNVNPAPIPNAGPDADICFGQNAQLNASGGTIYQWTPSTYLSSASSPNPIVNQPPVTTQYTLSVTDANGCTSLVTDNVLVKITPPIKVVVSPRDSIVAEGDQIQLNASSIGTNYTWTNPITLSNPNISNPVATMPAGSMGIIYNYVVTASTSAGCKGTASITLRVYKGPDIYVPTGFTPNGDGKNDKFYPFPVGIKAINYFRVYNRWGQLMFSTSMLNDGWDGTFAGRQQPSGTYVWVAQAVTSSGKIINKQGSVELIR